MPDKDKKEKRDEKKIEIKETEVEMRGFSGGEILKERYVTIDASRKQHGHG